MLAAPATAIAAIAVAGRHGILIKGTAFLENLADVTSIIFDKTGTLTTGELTLTDAQPRGGCVRRTRTEKRLAGSLGMSASSHPVSRAARRAVADKDLVPAVRAVCARGRADLASPALQGWRRKLRSAGPDLFARLGMAVPERAARA